VGVRGSHHNHYTKRTKTEQLVSSSSMMGKVEQGDGSDESVTDGAEQGGSNDDSVVSGAE
jgi:hypothetical protein